MTEKPMTVEQVAERWGCSTRSVYDAIKYKGLKAFRVGGKLLRVSAEEIARWESGGENTASENTGLGLSKAKRLSAGKTSKALTAEDLASVLPK